MFGATDCQRGIEIGPLAELSADPGTLKPGREVDASAGARLRANLPLAGDLVRLHADQVKHGLGVVRQENGGGAITGRALYDGRIDAKAALAMIAERKKGR